MREKVTWAVWAYRLGVSSSQSHQAVPLSPVEDPPRAGPFVCLELVLVSQATADLLAGAESRAEGQQTGTREVPRLSSLGLAAKG